MQTAHLTRQAILLRAATAVLAGLGLGFEHVVAARVFLTDFVGGTAAPPLDAMSIQAYYTWRLAAMAAMRIEILKDGADILLSAKPAST